MKPKKEIFHIFLNHFNSCSVDKISLSLEELLDFRIISVLQGAKKMNDFPEKRNQMGSQLTPKSHKNDDSKDEIRHHQKTGGINDKFHSFISFIINRFDNFDRVRDHRQTVADQKSDGDHQM